MKRKNRYTALTFVMVFISFLFSTAVSLASLHVMSQHNVRDIDMMLAARINEVIASQLSESITVARTMGHSSFLIQTLEQEQILEDNRVEQFMKGYLNGIQGGLSYSTAFIISDATRSYYTSSGITRTINPKENEADAWYSDFLKKKADYILDVDFDETDRSKWIVYINEKVKNSRGTLLGVCGVGIHMTNLQELFTSLEQEYSVKLTMINSDRIIQVDTQGDLIEQPYPDDISLSPEKRNEYVYQKGKGSAFTITKYIENLDWYLVVQDNGERGTAPYLNLILVNLVLCSLLLVILIFSVRHLRRHTRELSDASFKDQLTRLFNRRAYEEDKYELLQERPGTDFAHIAVDVNGLKTANDTMGHEAGDELLKGTADCMQKVFAGRSRVYRTGGDEFCVMTDMKEAQLTKTLDQFKQTVSTWSGTWNKSLSVSVGVASAREFPQEDIIGLIRISDERMYADKTEYYLRNGIDRRRS